MSSVPANDGLEVRRVLEPSFQGDLAALGAFCPSLKANIHRVSGVMFDDGKGGFIVG
jgi:hypothetical protein